MSLMITSLPFVASAFRIVRRLAPREGLASGSALLLSGLLAPAAASAQSCTTPPPSSAPAVTAPLVLGGFGSFMYSGSVDRSPNGETFHGDHGYVQYLVPRQPRDLPLVMWHGYGQSGKTWETTPDGREGFEQIFVRRGWPVFVVDQPRRGRAGKTSATGGDTTHKGSATESALWTNFRLGEWYPPAPPKYNACLQFDHSPAALDQFLRQQAPNTGDELFPSLEQRQFHARAMVALLRRSGPSVLLTHSHSGQYGWATAMLAPELVRAVVSYEPGEYAFPQDAVPPDIPTRVAILHDYLAPQLVPRAEFLKLTRMPIMVVLGDNISDVPSTDYGKELWRIVRQRARQFVDTVNKYGGDARLVELPTLGIRGNTHFPMSDLNNVTVADQLTRFLQEKGLDRRTAGYSGPKSAGGGGL